MSSYSRTETPKPKSIRDIDGDGINFTVERIGHMADKVWHLLDMVEQYGIDIGYVPPGTLTIRLGPKEPDA